MRTAVLSHFSWSLCLVALTHLGGCGQGIGDGSELDIGSSKNAIQFGTRMQVKSMSTDKCMDVAGGFTTPGNPIVQYRCHHGPAQQFILLSNTFNGFQIASAMDTSMCVGIQRAGDNELMTLMPCVDRNGWRPYTERWLLDGDDLRQPVMHVSLRSRAAPFCVDVPSGLPWDSLWLQVYGCHGGLNQQWELSNW